MNEKMTLVTHKATGHVLGVLTRAGNPEAALTPKDLAGADGLPIRDAATGDVHEVPTDQLKLETVDRNDEVLFRPTRYAMVAGGPLQQSDPSTIQVTLATTKLTIEGSALKTGDTVWVQIGGKPPLQAVAVSSTSSTAKVEFNLTLVSGTYHLMALVPGYWAYLKPHTI